MDRPNCGNGKKREPIVLDGGYPCGGRGTTEEMREIEQERQLGERIADSAQPGCAGQSKQSVEEDPADCLEGARDRTPVERRPTADLIPPRANGGKPF